MSFKPLYKLLNWIPETKLNLINLSKNENAVQILEKNASRICWSIWLYMNPNTVHIVEQHLKVLTDINCLDDIYWDELSANPNAVHIMAKYFDRIDWTALSGNENAIYILEKNLDKVNWEVLSKKRNQIYI